MPNLFKAIQNKQWTLLYVDLFKISVRNIAAVECKNGHAWKAEIRNIVRSKGCKFCNTLNSRHSLCELKDYAVSIGGELISDDFKNAHSDLLWKCSKNHIWRAPFNRIQSGTWCPYCGKYKSEEICRRVFEQLFGDKFIKIRPKWLMGLKNYPLELDGYSAKLNLAFEHNGLQHYGRCNNIYNYELIERLMRNDGIKEKKCKELGITLIEIPQLFTIVPLDQLKIFIKEMCEFHNYKLPPNFDNIIIDLDKF